MKFIMLRHTLSCEMVLVVRAWPSRSGFPSEIRYRPAEKRQGRPDLIAGRAQDHFFNGLETPAHERRRHKHSRCRQPSDHHPARLDWYVTRPAGFRMDNSSR